MDRRGGTSFAIFLVLNPILILFYQNCSVIPNKPAHANIPIQNYRTISSVHEDRNAENGNCRLVSYQSCAE